MKMDQGGATASIKLHDTYERPFSPLQLHHSLILYPTMEFFATHSSPFSASFARRRSKHWFACLSTFLTSTIIQHQPHPLSRQSLTKEAFARSHYRGSSTGKEIRDKWIQPQPACRSQVKRFQSIPIHSHRGHTVFQPSCTLMPDRSHSRLGSSPSMADLIQELTYYASAHDAESAVGWKENCLCPSIPAFAYWITCG